MSATTFQSQRTRPLPPKIHHPRCPQSRLSIQSLATLPIPPPAKRPGRRPQAHHAPSRRSRHPRHLSLREQVRRRLRTSHRLENLNKQIRRRTKVVSIFPNKESGLRLIASILMEPSDDWERGRSSLNPGHPSSQNNQTETQTINLMRIDTFTEKKLRCGPSMKDLPTFIAKTFSIRC